MYTYIHMYKYITMFIGRALSGSTEAEILLAYQTNSTGFTHVDTSRARAHKWHQLKKADFEKCLGMRLRD